MKQKEIDVKQFDILVEIKGCLEWFTGVFNETAEQAAKVVLDEVGGKYVGHKCYVIDGGKWVESAQ